MEVKQGPHYLCPTFPSPARQRRHNNEGDRETERPNKSINMAEDASISFVAPRLPLSLYSLESPAEETEPAGYTQPLRPSDFFKGLFGF